MKKLAKDKHSSLFWVRRQWRIKKRFIASTPGVVLRSVPLAGGSDDDDADGADGSAGRNGEGGGDGAGGVGGEAQTKNLKLV